MAKRTGGTSSDPDPSSPGRLARRSLRHRIRQTLLVVVVSALISGTAVFAAGYQQQVQQAAVDTTFAVDGPGNSWSLTGGRLTDLPALLPARADRLTLPPVAGRTAAVEWRVDDDTAEPTPFIKGGQRWRADICGHVVMVSGACPTAQYQVAVSTADARNFDVEVGDELLVQSAISPDSTGFVTGIFEVGDPDDPYWFDVLPVGRSVYQGDFRLSDDLITVADSFSLVATYQETLDVRVDAPAIRLADLDDLAAYTAELRKVPPGEVRLTTGIPASLDRVQQERQRAVAGLTLSLAQLAVLVVAVLALLVGVELDAQRAELGLGRLRGEPAAGLRRAVFLRWAAVVTAGWLAGWVPGLGLLAVVAAASPDGRGLLFGPALLLVPVACLVVLVAFVVPPARELLAQPVIGLLRSAPPAARDAGGRQRLLDVALLILAVTGLVVALQVGRDSVFGLLVPSLLALGAGISLYLLLVRLAARRRRLLAQRGTEPAALLRAILTFRLRGLRLLVVATCVAATFAVFAVQLAAIGDSVRRHDAEVRTGAAAVLTVDGDPTTVLSALARFDPRHATAEASATPVVVTRRSDPRALRGMFVEPAAFPSVAYGADRTAGPDTWAALAAPRVDPVVFRGTVLSAQVGRHDDLRRTNPEPPTSQGTSAVLGVDYRSADGTVRAAALGRLDLAAGGGERLAGSVLCQDGCNLLRITLTPDGPMEGTLSLSRLTAATGADAAAPLELGPSDRWSFIPANSGDALTMDLREDGPVLTGKSGGGRLTMQQAWLPTTLPALIAAGARSSAVPAVAAPDGTERVITPVAETADAIPHELDGTAVSDLESVFRAGQVRANPLTSVEVWVSDDAVPRLPELQQVLADTGVRVLSTESADELRSANRLTAAALSARIAPGLAVLAGVFAGLGIALTVSSQRPVLGRDLTALRSAGVDPTTVDRAAVSTYLWPGLLAVVLGAVAGSVGSALVIPELPMLADPSPAIQDDLGLRPVPLLGCVAAAAGVLTAVVLLSVRRLSPATPAGADEPGAER